MRHWSLLVAVLGSSQVGCESEDPVCSMLAPQCGLLFQIEISPRAGELLPQGSYTFDIETEQPSTSRHCVIESLSKVSCSGNSDGGARVQGNGVDAGRLSSFVISPGRETYGKVTIRVERDESVLIEQSFSPVYTTRTERADPRCSLTLTCTTAPTATVLVD